MKFNSAFMVLVFLAVSCAGRGRLDTRPSAERAAVRIGVPDGIAREECNCAHADLGKGVRAPIRRVALRFAPSPGNEGRETPEAALWRAHLEKELLRKGFVVYEEPRRDTLSIEEETRPAQNIDAFVMVDAAATRPLGSRGEVRFDDGPDGLVGYEYRYHVAEIRGRFMLSGNDIVASCGTSLSSFDLATGGAESGIELAGVCEYRHSGKLDAWVKDRWKVESARILPAGTARDEEAAKAELIKAASSRFLEGLLK
ncbi:MAG: hypothetical protein EPN93_01945 [Spirochaetes bacterium]|nr:MAG: hypothetical protein EPN93_01945 [Spirochaetota bacterium]